jgi:hypothetical protein
LINIHLFLLLLGSWQNTFTTSSGSNLRSCLRVHRSNLRSWSLRNDLVKSFHIIFIQVRGSVLVCKIRANLLSCAASAWSVLVSSSWSFVLRRLSLVKKFALWGVSVIRGSVLTLSTLWWGHSVHSWHRPDVMVLLRTKSSWHVSLSHHTFASFRGFKTKFKKIRLKIKFLPTFLLREIGVLEYNLLLDKIWVIIPLTVRLVHLSVHLAVKRIKKLSYWFEICFGVFSKWEI